MKPLPLLTAALMACGLLTPTSGVDWPSWGGGDPGRNMYSPARGLPTEFDAGKTKPGSDEIDLKTTKNVKWVVKLGSQSYANPTVFNGKVFVGTNNETPRDPRHVGDRSILMCFDEKTGAFLWQLVVPKLKSGKVNDWENLGLFSSPVHDGKHLYIVTSRCEVLCLDINGMADGNDGPYTDEAKYVVMDTGKPPIDPGAKDADIVWRYDMMDELGVFPHNASNCNILMLGDLLYICTSNGQDWTHVNVPSPNSPSFIALNKKTGALEGEDDAQIGPRILHGQWSSPAAGQVNGKWQIYFGGGDGVLYAFDQKPVKEGDVNTLKTAWKFDCVPPEYKVKDSKPIKYPAAEGPSEINSTPVFYKGKVYVAIGQDPEHGEGVGRLVCVDPTGTGDVTKTKLVWDYKGIKRSISTVSIDPSNGLLFIGDFSGFVHCLDAETGKLHWVHDMKAHMWGSTFVADGKVYVGDEDGDFAILASSKEKKVLNEVNMGYPVYGTPIVANGVMYVMNQSYLYAFHDASKAAKDEVPKVEIKQ
jgi:outer membrane protein assembly factor BamB